jgi:hypothetical protein
MEASAHDEYINHREEVCSFRPEGQRRPQAVMECFESRADLLLSHGWRAVRGRMAARMLLRTAFGFQTGGGEPGWMGTCMILHNLWHSPLALCMMGGNGPWNL